MKPLHLSNQQLDVMRVLWTRGDSTVAEVQKALLPDHELAYTTVATVLNRLVEAGAVAKHSQGRQHEFRALVEETEVQRSMTKSLVERLFGGDPSELLTHLVASRALDRDDLDRAEALLEQARRSSGSTDPTEEA